MKLIDLLAQELPKLGGWPSGAKWIEQACNGCLFSDNTKVSKGYCFDGKGFEKVDDWQIGNVTCEQYEAALSASKKPEWNGEGLPPVGVECEMSLGDDEWSRCVIIAKGEEQIIYQAEGCREFSGHRNNYRFRPVRSEADRKRDDTILAMASAPKPCGHPIASICAEIYDAIAAGKIPGIRIE